MTEPLEANFATRSGTELEVTFLGLKPGQINGLTLWACIVRFRTAASMVVFLNSPKVIFCPISTNKISLEKSWNYLNADSSCEKI